MIAVLAANISSTEAVQTTATLTGSPPHSAPSSEMNRSCSVALIASGSSAIENSVSNGEVITIVMITSHMPRVADCLSGSRIAGLSWLMLSRPENANHAPAKPTRNVVFDSDDPSCRLCQISDQCGGPMCAQVTPTTTRS